MRSKCQEYDNKRKRKGQNGNTKRGIEQKRGNHMMSTLIS